MQYDDEMVEIRRGAPALGEHTDEVLSDLGYTPDELDALATPARSTDGDPWRDAAPGPVAGHAGAAICLIDGRRPRVGGTSGTP